MLIYCSPPTQGDEDVAFSTIVATSTNSVGACLKQIPNQPIVFQVFTCPIILDRPQSQTKPGIYSKTGGSRPEKRGPEFSAPLAGFLIVKLGV